MQKWKTVSSTQIIRDQWISLRADACELPNGSLLRSYYVVDEKEWVHVFAVDDTNRVLTVRQYRYAANAVCIELPGGMVDDGESPLDAAMRELKEETGFTANTWTKVGSVYANPARQTNSIHIFLARDLEQTGTLGFDESEDIACAFMATSEIKQAIVQGGFSQALHIASFYISLEALARSPGHPAR